MKRKLKQEEDDLKRKKRNVFPDEVLDEVNLGILEKDLHLEKTREYFKGWEKVDGRIEECGVVMETYDTYCRTMYLELLVKYWMEKDRTTYEENSKLLLTFSEDSDSRIRGTVLNCLQKLVCVEWSDGWRQKCFKLSLQSMLDDDSMVRMYSMEVCSIISNLFFDNFFEGKRMVDIGFERICAMVRDPATEVRAKAASLLGSFEKVNSEILYETFDKMKLEFSHAQVYHEKKKLIENELDADMCLEDMSHEETDHLLFAGALGTFVLALEDEFQVVRKTALNSICSLCKVDETFSRIALDFIIEIFNDDIDDVRIHAIECVCQLSKVIVFNEQQIHISLVLLEDQNEKIRKTIHQFLSSIKMASPNCILATALGLFSNMNKYKEDIDSIYGCLQCIGKNHSELTPMIMEELLRLDTFIQQPQRPLDDKLFVGSLILISNACSKNQSIISCLPKYISENISQLKRQYPQYFPDIMFHQISNGITYVTINGKNSIEKEDRRSDMGLKLFSQIERLFSLRKYAELCRVSTELMKEFCRGKMIASVQFLGQCLKIVKRLAFLHWKNHQIHEHDIVMNFQEKCKSLIHLTYVTEKSFLNVNAQIILSLKEIRLCTHIHSVIAKGGKLVKYFFLGGLESRVASIKMFCQENDIDLPQWVASNPIRPNCALTQKALHDWINLYTVNFRFESLENLSSISAEIVYPESQIEIANEIYSFIPFRLETKIKARNVSPDVLRLIVRFPDGKEKWYRLNQTPELDQCYLCHPLIPFENAWKGAGKLSLQIGMMYQPDFHLEYDDMLVHHTNPNETRMSEYHCDSIPLGEAKELLICPV